MLVQEQFVYHLRRLLRRWLHSAGSSSAVAAVVERRQLVVVGIDAVAASK